VTQMDATSAQKWMRNPRRRRQIIMTAIAAVICLFFLRMCLHGTKKTDYTAEGAFAQPVTVATAMKGDLPIIMTELGTVVPITNVTVQSRVSGYIMAVNFSEGQHVKSGDELVLIDPRPYEIALEQALGTLQQDEAQLADARINSGRYEKLIRQKSVAAMTAKDAQYKVQQLEGTVKLDRANVDNARLNLEYCHIRAPVDGRIGLRAVDRGNYFTAGQSGGLAVLTQMQPISVMMTVPQNQLTDVMAAMTSSGALKVEAWDSNNTVKIAEGSVQAVDSQIDTATGTVRMRAIFPNLDERLFPNEFVNARLNVRTLHDVILLPADAVQTGPDGAYVYLIKKDDTVTLRTVLTGQSDATRTEILQGVTTGDRVVLQGTNHLREGSKIRIENSDSDETSQPDMAAPKK